MTHPTIILQEAEDELWEAVAFYEQKCAGLGLDFENEVKAALEVILNSPERWSLREDGTRRCLLRRFPYFIVYLYEAPRIWVIAFAHCKRKPRYWSGRVQQEGGEVE